MSADRLQQLLALADEADQAELKIAHNGRVQAMSGYQKAPGKATAADMAAARAVYEETLARLERKYRPEAAPAPEGERFANRKQALNWLHAQGYKISQGKFYQDCDGGFPAVHRDKTVSRYQVLQYAQQQDVERRAPAGTDLAGRKEDADTRKAEAEARIKERQDERERRELDAEWVRREQADEITCVWVSRHRDAVAYHLGKSHLALIHACGGNPARLAEVQAVVDAALAAAANEIASSDEITVQIEDTAC